jgi:hypothetical protein
MAESLWKRFAELALEVEGYELERLEEPVTRGFTRVTTVVHLRGGDEGVGEDVTWYPEHHDREQSAGPVLPLVGSWTLATFSAALEMPDPHRRWAYESAALDLALRQAGTTFAEAVGREPRPLAFVVSPGLGDPPSAAPVRRWLELDQELRFKLDPAGDWTDELIAELAGTRAVVAADYKAYYAHEGDAPPDADLYRRIAEGFPEAYLEDPALTDETEPVLEAHRDRVTWDAPIHSVEDVEQLAWPPRVGQIQYLASLFHADAPNDVAPRAYNAPEPSAGLPRSPLDPAPSERGFRWAEHAATI